MNLTFQVRYLKNKSLKENIFHMENHFPTECWEFSTEIKERPIGI